MMNMKRTYPVIWALIFCVILAVGACHHAYAKDAKGEFTFSTDMHTRCNASDVEQRVNCLLKDGKITIVLNCKYVYGNKDINTVCTGTLESDD